jgi:hypothetical protein
VNRRPTGTLRVSEGGGLQRDSLSLALPPPRSARTRTYHLHPGLPPMLSQLRSINRTAASLLLATCYGDTPWCPLQI